MMGSSRSSSNTATNSRHCQTPGQVCLAACNATVKLHQSAGTVTPGSLRPALRQRHQRNPQCWWHCSGVATIVKMVGWIITVAVSSDARIEYSPDDNPTRRGHEVDNKDNGLAGCLRPLLATAATYTMKSGLAMNMLGQNHELGESGSRTTSRVRRKYEGRRLGVNTLLRSRHPGARERGREVLHMAQSPRPKAQGPFC